MPNIGFPNSPLLLEFQTIVRMHGTFDRDTTPPHVAQMAQAHKVYNHPQSTSKEKLYWELNGLPVNSTTFMSCGILNRRPCKKIAAVPKTILKNNLKVASHATSIDMKYVWIYMTFDSRHLISSFDCVLDLLDCLFTQSECFFQDHLADAGIEQRYCLYLRAWVLAVQGCNCSCSTVAHVELEVQKTSREHKHIALLQCGCKKCSIGAHETDEQRTLHHEDDLCGPRVRVGWDETSFSEVQACHGNPQSVDARELTCSCWCDLTSKGVVGVSGGGQESGLEVGAVHKGRVLADQTVNDGGVGAIGDTEVLFGVRIWRNGHHGEES